MSSVEEALKSALELQKEITREQAERIDSAIDMLENLVVENDADGFAIEKIIKVLMYGD